MTPDDVRRLEDLANHAWPPRSTERGDGWELRFGDGLHSRRNSATVWPGAPGTPAEHRRHIEAAYRGRGARPIVKLTAASKPGLDQDLAAAGWSLLSPTIVMVRPANAASPGPTRVDTSATGLG